MSEPEKETFARRVLRTVGGLAWTLGLLLVVTVGFWGTSEEDEAEAEMIDMYVKAFAPDDSEDAPTEPVDQDFEPDPTGFYGSATYPNTTSGDLDCAQIGHPVAVGPDDPHRLDGDGDGIGCESY
jgi:hypothetical protein